MRTFLSVCFGLVGILSAGHVAAQEPKPSGATLPAVTLGSTETRTISSKVLSRDFQISISLPWSYRITQKRYPAVYILDADLGFGLAHTAYQASQLDGNVPELILIGIGYGIDISSAFSTWSTRRTQEMTPSAAKDYPGSGEAAGFSRFIREELIPLIDANYRTDPADRTLAGTSFGGLFATYVMLQTPSPFQQYIVRSPSLWWDDRTMFTLENAYSGKHRDLPATMFTSMGSAETDQMMSTWKEFVAVLTKRQYDGFRLITTTIQGAKHATAGAIALFDGLKAVFGGWPVDAEMLDRYVGRFVLPGNEIITIAREGQGLSADWNGKRKLNLLARAPAKFAFTTGEAELLSGEKDLLPLVGLQYIDFRGSGRRPVESITIHQNGKPIVAPRAK